MPTKPIDRLLFAQGGLCFFCAQSLSGADASVEHLVASANGGSNGDDNCVACCKSLNMLLGSMSLKEKIKVFLNQKGSFKCPNGAAKSAPAKVAKAKPVKDKYAEVVANLKQRGKSKPLTIKKLRSTINSLYQNKLPEKELSSLVQQLQDKGDVVVSGESVGYGW